MKQNGVFWQVGLLVSMLSACDYIQDDLQPCPTGLELAFRYDYNLQRADQFNDHVRSVTAYLFDEEGYFVAAQTESGTPLSERTYRMKLDVDPGRYQCVVVAGQKPVKEMAAGPRAKQIVHEPEVGDSLSALSVTLERDAQGLVTHHGLPLDTLWHGMRLTPIEVKAGQITVDTLSLMRNTKQINVILRDLDEPENMEVANYDFRIDDHNACLRWDNSVDETAAVVYTPYATWNTTDKQVDAQQPTGRMAHADFMTSRLLFHKEATADAVLTVTEKESGKELIRVNLPDLLSRMRTSDELNRYTPQEFLDRGYDYHLTFFLQGDRWAYVQVEIGVLSWAQRFQFEQIKL